MSFAEARAAMSSELGGGPANPSNINPTTGSLPGSSNNFKPSETSGSSHESPSAGHNTELEQALSAEVTPQEAEELLDLMSVNKKLKIGEDVYTLDELKKSILRHKDYTKKTQGLAEQRKQAEKTQEFVSNFAADLDLVLKDPQKWESAFRQTYPQHFQDVYDKIMTAKEALIQTQGSPRINSNGNPEVSQILKLYENLNNKFSGYEQQMHTAQVEKEAVRLDNLFTKLHSKYDLGDKDANEELENLVLAKAQLKKSDLTDTDFESLFKDSYSRFKKLTVAQGEKQFRSQQQANQKAKDTPAGGGIPGQAPINPKTFKEARKAMEDHLRMTGKR